MRPSTRMWSIAALVIVALAGCVRAQTPTGSCSGEGCKGVFNNETCACVCSEPWTGGNCTVCPSQYEQTNCSACAPGRTDFPQCYIPECSVSANCSGHATNATLLANLTCSCDCATEWGGADCSVCPARFEQVNCSSCGPQYDDNFPTCTYNSTCVPFDCNYHASSVSGDRDAGGCTCECRNSWEAPNCATCPREYNATNDCSGCGKGYLGTYPDNCTLDTTPCNIDDDCGGRAKFVVGTRGTGCNCTCLNKYEGNACQYCPANYDADDRCGSCASGFNSWPNCYPVCDNRDDCNGRAERVTGNKVEGCKCKCINRYDGQNCSVCPSRFDPTTGCRDCINSAYGGPDCKLLCTVADNCTDSDHAWSVTGYADETCSCDCKFSWSSPNCGTCESKYTGRDCDRCGKDRSPYPACVFCSKAFNCSSHATEVEPVETSPTEYGCKCSCRNGWFGEQCEFCPRRYDPTFDCASCSYGFYGGYPSCFIGCDAFYNCSDHAAYTNWTGPGPNSICTCHCRNMWNGSDCSNCSFPYDPEQDCGECVAGYGGYPNCTKLPSMTAEATRTTTRDPNYVTPTVDPPPTPTHHATLTVDPNAPTPTVIGTRSSTIINNTDTVQPTPTRTNESTPSATISPTISESECAQTRQECIDRGEGRALPIPPENCFCACVNNWTQMWCNYCPPRFNETLDCGECAHTYVLYPRCDYLTHVTGNWSFQIIPTDMQQTLDVNDIWTALATDLNFYINTTLNCTNSLNVTAYIIDFPTRGGDPKELYFEFDVDIMDPLIEETDITASCITDGLRRVGDIDLVNVTSLIAELYPQLPVPGAAFVLENNTFINTTDLPQSCVDMWSDWCFNMPPLVLPPPYVPPPPFPWYAVVAGILGAALLAALAYYFCIAKPRAEHQAKYGMKRNDMMRVRKLCDEEALWVAAEAGHVPAAKSGSGVRANDLLNAGMASDVYLSSDVEMKMKLQNIDDDV